MEISILHIYQENNQWFQGWYDNVKSLSLKYDLVNKYSF